MKARLIPARIVGALVLLILTAAVILSCSSNDPVSPGETPAAITNPSPADGAVDQDVNFSLSWSAAVSDGDPLTFDVYLGTAAAPPLVAANVAAKTYDPGELLLSSQYHWKVVAKDPQGHATVGPVWSFGTHAGIWRVMTSGTSEYLTAVSGAAANDVYAVGGPQVFRFDGTSWSATAVGSALWWDVWAGAPNDVWIVGPQGAVRHYDGSSWAPLASGTTEQLYAVWGTGTGDVYTVGSNGTILRTDGTSWNSMTSGVTASLWGVWGSSPDDVFAVGSGGTIVHFDGASWTAMGSATAENFEGVGGSAADDVFAVGSNGVIRHYDGAGWTVVDAQTTAILRDVWASSSRRVLVTGDAGTILTFNGDDWSKATVGQQDLWGIWGASGNDLFAAGADGTILRYGPQ